jgi:hypothetical protein
MAPSIATVNAGDSNVRINSGRKSGMCSSGKPDGIPPNREPMVATSSPKAIAATVPAKSATMYAGTRFTYRLHRINSSSVVPPSATLSADTAPTLTAMASMRPRNSPGTSTVRPRKSLSCVLAMTTAIPFVKPMITGRGMYRTAVPDPVMPMMTSITPAIIVHMNRPSTP